MADYILSVKADADLDDITYYTLEQWGENQTEIYITALLDCFQKLAEKPDLGRIADGYKLNLKRYYHNAHSIFYEPTDEGVFIVRILGQRQDFAQHL